MKSVNKVILVGLVRKDPEVKYTASGIPVGRFSLATNERFKDKTGKFQDRSEWHNIVVWQKLAELVGEFVCVIFSNSWPERPHYGLLKSLRLQSTARGEV